MANIWGSDNKLIGSVEKSGDKGDLNTYGSTGQPLGKVRESGTYKPNATKISTTRDAGLTFRK